jgi:hypothetical protein
MADVVSENFFFVLARDIRDPKFTLKSVRTMTPP